MAERAGFTEEREPEQTHENRQIPATSVEFASVPDRTHPHRTVGLAPASLPSASLLFAALLMIPLPAHAEGPGRDDPGLARTFFLAGAAADWTGTVAFQRVSQERGYFHTEQNPLINWTDNVPTMIALGAAIDVGGYWLAHRLVARRHPKLFKVGLYAAGSFRFYLAAKNVYKIPEQSALPCRRVECGYLP